MDIGQTPGNVRAICVETTSFARMAEEAVRRYATCLDEGNAPEDVLVLAATRTFAQSVVRAGLPAEAHMLTFDELADMILGHDGVGAALGRGTRALLSHEEKVLFEDMKVSGLKVKRLREMLKFLFKGLSEGMDADPSWLINNEERSLLAFMLDHLKERGAILACERGNLALKAVADDRVRRAFSRGTLIVCGYSSLDRCGQQLAAALANGLLVAIGSPFDAGTAQIAYPYAQGMGELANDGAEVVALDKGATGRVDGMRAALASRCIAETPVPERAPSPLPGPDAGVAVYRTPDDEFDGVAAAIRNAVHSGVDPSEFLVAAPNAAYLRGMRAALDAAGVANASPLVLPFSKGDPRKDETSGPMRFLAALELAADDRDVVGWRSWLGFGDWLLRSDAWEMVRRIAGEREVSVMEAIDLVRDCLKPDSGMELGPQAAIVLKLAGPLRAADCLLADCSGLEGDSLIDVIARHAGWSPDLVTRRLLLEAGTDAKAMCAAVRRAAFDPEYPRGGTVVALADECRGMSAAGFVLSGMVDGYLPAYAACDENETIDRRAKLQQAERRRFLSILGSASQEVLITAFEEADAEVADKSKVDIGRIFVRRGARLATAKPSRFLAECL